MAELIEALRDPADVEDGNEGVWPEHVAIVQAFLAVCTQWRTAPAGGGFAPMMPIWIGLDYSAVRVGLEAEGIAITPELWRGLRVMEDEATDALNKAD
ncbi:DUF1799 domain-containing protein [Bradyrhizobium sp. 31Argb]|uniref:DUF1799 domain-containing protein n=1 Tax=Bradyrhizobium sp. 31Argb TaxID=3141247 RepID=UPI00374840F5